MKKTSEIDWTKVERLIRLSMKGYLDHTDMFERAFEADPARYRELHARVQKEEMKLIKITL